MVGRPGQRERMRASRMRHRVTTKAAGALDAVLVMQLAPDLIVLDAMWLNNTEWVLLQSLPTDPRTQVIPVVLCTIPVMTIDTVQACLDRLAARIVAKPYILKDLLHEIHAALDNGEPVARDPGGGTKQSALGSSSLTKVRRALSGQPTPSLPSTLAAMSPRSISHGHRVLPAPPPAHPVLEPRGPVSSLLTAVAGL